MGKATADAVFDAALGIVKSSTNAVCVCTSEPTTYSQATSTYKLAQGTITSANWAAIANYTSGSTTGRYTYFTGKSSISVTGSGTAAHVAWVSTSATALRLVTTCSSQVLTSGNKVNVPGSIDVIFVDPT